MTIDPVAKAGPPVAPRPGIAKTLGIVNIILAIILGANCLWMALMVLAVAMAEKPDGGAAMGGKPESMLSAMTGPAMIRFGVIDVVTAIPLQVVMFASGIGLLNLRRWGARWWARGCWAKIVRLVAVWSFFLFGVVPPLSAAMGRTVVAMFREQQKSGGVGGPSIEQMTLIYTVMLSVIGVAMILLGVIYPAVSLWLLGRPGVEAALTSSPTEADPEFQHGLANKVTPP